MIGLAKVGRATQAQSVNAIYGIGHRAGVGDKFWSGEGDMGQSGGAIYILISKAKFGSCFWTFCYPKRKIGIQNQRGFWDSTYRHLGDKKSLLGKS